MFGKIMFYLFFDRVGPDMPLTHWMLHSKRLGSWLCHKKFFRFGKNAQVRPFSYLIKTSKISIGNNVVIRPGCMFFADGKSEITINIDDDVLIGSGVHIYVSNHSFIDATLPIYYQGHQDDKPVSIESGAWIGANVIILPGVTIGKNSVVGAGAVVTKDIPPHSVAVGNPAKIIRDLL